jgi:uncharacterized protein YgbK (DUF1537 family)
VRGPVEKLARRMAAAPTAVITADAVDAGDLLQVSQATLLNDFLPCGATGFAHAWAQSLSGGRPPQPAPGLPEGGGPLLIVAGSANPRTHEQIAALARHPDCLVWHLHVPLNPEEKTAGFERVKAAWSTQRVVVLCPGLQSTVRDPAWLGFSQAESRLAVELLQQVRPSALLITGGETANTLCGLLDLQAVRLLGEAMPGAPVGVAVGGQADSLVLLTKSGGNGRGDYLERLIYG